MASILDKWQLADIIDFVMGVYAHPGVDDRDGGGGNGSKGGMRDEQSNRE